MAVSILAVMGVMAVSFAFWMRLEYRAATNFLAATQAVSVAEAGMAHARSVLYTDRFGGVDTEDDLWRSVFSGSDADTDGDGEADARWISCAGAAEDLDIRYAVLIRDEASKLNLNSAGIMGSNGLVADLGQGWSTAEIDPDKCLAGLLSGQSGLAAAFVRSRLGADQRPGDAGVDDDGDAVVLGADGIDNNGNGLIDEPGEGVDEPDEFREQRPYGDDLPWLTIHEFKQSAGLDSSVWEILKKHLTVNSSEPELFWKEPVEGGVPEAGWRRDANWLTAPELAALLIDAGVSNPWQIAANIADAVDPDYAMSFVAAQCLFLGLSSASVEAGGWIYDGVAKIYRNSTAGSDPGRWIWSSVPVGTYRVQLLGEEGAPAGDADIWGSLHKGLQNAEFFGGEVSVVDELPTDGRGPLELTLSHSGEAANHAFSGLSLIPVEGGSPSVSTSFVRGIEAVRINELMVNAKLSLSGLEGQDPGGHWSVGGAAYRNPTPNGGVMGEGKWQWSGIPNGFYYLQAIGEEGLPVGDVIVGSYRENHVSHLKVLDSAVKVSDGKLLVRIQNNELSGSCGFAGLILSQEPDIEYIELINLSSSEIDVGSWTVDGPGSAGWPATIPLGTVIPPKEHLVLAPDYGDDAPGLSGNGVAVLANWPAAQGVRLDFAKALRPGDDLLPSSGVPSNQIVLRDIEGYAVDQVEYPAGTSFISWEKGDPGEVIDSDQDGFDQAWYASKSAATPGQPNNNVGLEEWVGGDLLVHSDTDLEVRNAPLAHLGQLAGLAAGGPWRRLDAEELGRIADRLTVRSIRLEAENAMQSTGAWTQVPRPYPWSDWYESSGAGNECVWSWGPDEGIENGIFFLHLVGGPRESMKVSYKQGNGSWSDWTPPLGTDASGRLSFGLIEIGTGTALCAADRNLELRLSNQSASGIAHLDAVVLEPLRRVYGRLNLNTADPALLQGLPGVDAGLAEKIVGGRPYRAIGELLTRRIFSRGPAGSLAEEREREREEIEAFGRVASLVTVGSRAFEIVVLGQVLQGDEVLAERRVWAVVER
ncbi:MAG: hypothetical protein JW937_07815 [Candidatus Omnitrophica bacterium]|nr:hypothetical protein [Candidatus Omnitrophota bacterium]